MILHYLKLTLRKLGKNYIFAAINIGGLIIALASAFLIFHFVLSEFTTNHFNKNKDSIYRNIFWFEERADEKIALCASSYIMAENIKGKFPEIKNIARIYNLDHYYSGQYILMNGESIKTTHFQATDPSFLDIFTFKVVSGNRNNLLPDENSVLISESMAKKFFPNKEALGKTLRVENTKETKTYLITGVFEDLPPNSTIQANFITHIDLAGDYYRKRGWWISATDTYFQLHEESDPKALEKKISAIIKKEHPKRPYSISLQKLTDIHFKSGFISYYNEPMGNYKLIMIYSIIGIIILLIASINYIIISTASSTERMIEIGMRKVMGAKHSTIVTQMISESILFTFIAFPLAVIVSEFALPTFNHLLGKELKFEYFENWPYLLGIFLITLFISLLSGSYISVFVSRFSPEQIFKKRFSKHHIKFNVRKVLIVIQIIAFMVLLSFSSVIIKQINYLLDKNVGYDPENMINVIPAHDHYLFSCKAFTDELLKNPYIESVSEVNAGIFSHVTYEAGLATNDTPEDYTDFNLLQADHQFLTTLKFNLIEGRNFDKNLSSDTACIILNKTAQSKLKLKNPINMVLKSQSGKRYRVIGVVDDFHYQSMHSLIPPMGIILPRYQTMVDRIIARVNPNNQQQTIAFMEDSWNQYGPEGRFKYEFFDQKIKEQYADDRNFSATIEILSILTVLIAAFGIFGFSFYNALQKVKEIGIRKVYGASVKDIINMIYKELGLLILVSAAISTPIAYLICEQWLNNYAYRIHFPYWIFGLVFFVSFFIVFVTTGITAYNAANRNPVDSLRYE